MRSAILAGIAFAAALGGAVQADVRIVDGDTLDLNGERYRINGIDAPEAGQTCRDGSGRAWACGDVATEALYQLTRRGRVTCEALAPDGYGRTIARCTASGRDLAREMVSLGMAWAFLKFSDEYAPQMAAAKAQKLGVWRGSAQPPWEFRAARWAKAEQAAPEGCPIKGNISANGKIYHPPWSPWYSRTRINESKGERWFCDEGEALEAGWRAPYWK